MNTPTHCTNCTVRPAVTGTLLCRECGEQLVRDNEISRGVRQGEADMLAYRRTHFAVKCGPSRLHGEPQELVLSITTNGNQWQSLGLLPEEVDRAVTALTQARLTAMWPEILSSINLGDGTPFAAATVEFQEARDRYDRASRAMSTHDYYLGCVPEEQERATREEWHNAGVDLSILYDRLLSQIQRAGMLPDTSVVHAKPTA